MPELWGIDDENESERIRKAALRKAPKSLLFGWWIAFAVIVIVWAELFSFPTGWPRTALMVMIMALLIVGQNRRAAKLFPRILEAEGRCPNCGYDLTNNEGRPCPECGKYVANPKQNNGNQPSDGVAQ